MAKPLLQDAETLRLWAIHADRQQALLEIAALTERLIAEGGRGLALDAADLCGLDLSGFDLRRASMRRTLLHSAKLDGANLSGAILLCPGAEKTSFRHADFSGAYLHAFAGQVCDFSHARLDAVADFTGGLLHGCRLEGTQLRGAMLSATTFYQCHAAGAVFDGSDLEAASFVECTLDQASFRGCNLELAAFRRCGMRATILAGARGRECTIQSPTGADGLELARAVLPGLRLGGVTATDIRAEALSARGIDVADCRLPNADLRSADLRGGRFDKSALPGADLREAILAEVELRDVDVNDALLVGVTAENLHALRTSFHHADLTAIKARCAVFRSCHMQGARLERAYLYRVMITGDPPSSANLRNVCLDDAVLVQAYLCADFTGASLTNVRLDYVRMNQSILDGADLRGSSLPFASMVKVSFHGAQIGDLGSNVYVDRCEGLAAACDAARTVNPTLETRAAE